MAESINTTKRPVVLALLLLVGGVIGWWASFQLTIERIEMLIDPTFSPSCNISPLVTCGANMESWQGSVFGFPNSLIGIAAFVAPIVVGMAILSGATFANWFWAAFNVGLLGGIVFVGWLISQSIFLLGTLCPYCMVVWSVMIPLFVTVTIFNLGRGTFGGSAAFKKFFSKLYPWSWVIVLVGYLIVVALAHFRLDAINTILLYS